MGIRYKNSIKKKEKTCILKKKSEIQVGWKKKNCNFILTLKLGKPILTYNHILKKLYFKKIILWLVHAHRI